MKKSIISFALGVVLAIAVFFAFSYYLAYQDARMNEVIDFSKKGETYILEWQNNYSVRSKQCVFNVSKDDTWCLNEVYKAPANIKSFVGKKVNIDGFYDSNHNLNITKIVHINAPDLSCDNITAGYTKKTLPFLNFKNTSLDDRNKRIRFQEVVGRLQELCSLDLNDKEKYKSLGFTLGL